MSDFAKSNDNLAVGEASVAHFSAPDNFCHVISQITGWIHRITFIADRVAVTATESFKYIRDGNSRKVYRHSDKRRKNG